MSSQMPSAESAHWKQNQQIKTTDATLVHYITSEIPAAELWLERIRMVMQADPILKQLKHQIFQEWPDAGRSIPDNITHSGTTGMAYW